MERCKGRGSVTLLPPLGALKLLLDESGLIELQSSSCFLDVGLASPVQLIASHWQVAQPAMGMSAPESDLG